MSRLTIGIDVDDVVARLIDAWLLEYNRRSGDRLTPDDLESWEISEFVKPEWKEKVFTLLTPAMYDTVEPYEGAVHAVAKIVEAGHRVVFITSAHTRDLFDAKVQWLVRHNFVFSEAHGVGPWSDYKSKAHVPGIDWLIDDHIGNFKDFQGYAVLQTRPHNRLLPWWGKRIKSLEDVVPMLQNDLRSALAESHETNSPLVQGLFPGVALKQTNPKDAIGSTKVPLHFVSGVVKAYAAVAHYLGNVKYGAWNYREGGARASVYVSALQRHIDKWVEGQENDPVDQTPHLANALACINILIEASENGNLVDDRPPSQIQALERVYGKVEQMMVDIRERYKDREPRHYTIADTKTG